MGRGRSDGRVAERASQGWPRLAEEATQGGEPPGRSRALGEGNLWLLFVLSILYLLSKESLPLVSVCKSPFQTKGNKKQVIFMSHKIVLKHKSICFTRSTFLL